MGFFNIKNWLAEKPEKKIYKIQKVIDQLNEALDIIAKSEKRYLDDSAAQLEQASEFGGRFASTHMERKEMSDEAADYYASMRPPFLEYTLEEEDCVLLSGEQLLEVPSSSPSISDSSSENEILHLCSSISIGVRRFSLNNLQIRGLFSRLVLLIKNDWIVALVVDQVERMFDWLLKRLGKGKDKDKIRKSAVDKIEETIKGFEEDEDKYKGKLAKAETDITKATAINDTTGSARALADKLFYEEQLVSVAAYIHCLKKQLRSLESSENSQPLLKALKVSAKANKRLLWVTGKVVHDIRSTRFFTPMAENAYASAIFLHLKRIIGLFLR
ncbi:unnamed protein product [Arabidopsis arenosa]|uniref:Uncharacterized protein n=1 Tax=Arabidopsis arenosa TaxID=38785 RepID=A0A8S2AD51_ARAAE|nr:unnamed protein product [Arabidopsis arenosa]